MTQLKTKLFKIVLTYGKKNKYYLVLLAKYEINLMYVFYLESSVCLLSLQNRISCVRVERVLFTLVILLVIAM